jgi:hypothetical protein
MYGSAMESEAKVASAAMLLNQAAIVTLVSAALPGNAPDRCALAKEYVCRRIRCSGERFHS